LQELSVVLTPVEETFARLYVLYNNATRAYIEAANYTGKRVTARAYAWELSNRPHVLQRVRAFESAAAAAVVIDYAAILDHDRQIVEGYKHADKITQHIWQCCRYCYGTEHKYQWIDFEEYLEALSKAEAENETRRARKLDEKPLPSDAGGYGFEVSADPNITCPHCEGRGNGVTVIADTTKLEGPARAIVKGVKVTANGIEVLLHDVDKAKERLLRAGGYLKDDAASVARGAAAGAAAGATAAIAAAKAAENMTVDEAQRLYLELA
jgi:phage terminase small subunit